VHLTTFTIFSSTANTSDAILSAASALNVSVIARK